MRKVSITLVCAIVASAGAAVRPAGAQVNGTVTMRRYGENGTTSTFTETRKGHKIRFDAPEEKGERGGFGGGAFIVDDDAHVTTILMPERKQYMQITAADAQRFGDMARMRAGEQGGRSDASPPDFKIEKTGRTEVVAGVKCDIYHASGTHDGKLEQGEVCIAEGAGFTPFDMGGGAMMGRMNRASRDVPQVQEFRELLRGDRGIMKVWRIENGKPMVEMEVTKVDRSAPSDATFQPPPDYTKFEMPNRRSP